MPHAFIVEQLGATVKGLKDKKGLKKAKTKNPKLIPQLRSLKYYFPASYPMKGRQKQVYVVKVLKAIDKSLGDRTKGSELVGDDYSFNKQGIWTFATPNPEYEASEANAKYLFFAPGSDDAAKKATGVYHKYAHIFLTFTQLGATSFDPSWSLENNFKDQEVSLTDNKRITIKLWNDCKDHAYYTKLEERISKEAGTEWTDFFGDEMQKERKEISKELVKAADELKKKSDENYTPVKKTVRKRIRCGNDD